MNDAPATAASPDFPHTFRVSQLGLFVAITLAICVTPLAISSWWLLELYLIPIAVAYWVRRVGTTVDANGLSARGVFRIRRVTWDHITALRLRTRSRVSAVCDDGSELPLPAVHLRDLPALAVVSGGRIPDPITAHEAGSVPAESATGATETAPPEPAPPEE